MYYYCCLKSNNTGFKAKFLFEKAYFQNDKQLCIIETS